MYSHVVIMASVPPLPPNAFLKLGVCVCVCVCVCARARVCSMCVGMSCVELLSDSLMTLK